MTGSLRISIWALLIGICIGGASPAWGNSLPPDRMAFPRVYDLNQEHDDTVDTTMSRLAAADVVYLAETHDRPQDHQAQLAILQALAARRSLIIGMEMFQRPFQWALDHYLAGSLSESDLIRQTEYANRWGFDWELYAPIVRFARDQKIPILALNTPSEVTRKVAQTGFGGLTQAERQWIPPQSSIRAEPEIYRQRIRQLYDEIHQGRGTSARFEQFFLAQVLWDETMADRIAIALRQSSPALIVVLAGQGHILYRYGIPDRVARRVPTRDRRPLQQVTVILNPVDSLTPEPGIADYFWYSSELNAPK